MWDWMRDRWEEVEDYLEDMWDEWFGELEEDGDDTEAEIEAMQEYVLGDEQDAAGAVFDENGIDPDGYDIFDSVPLADLHRDSDEWNWDG